MTPFLYTLVTLDNGGTVRFDRCVADVEGDALEITSTEDDTRVALLDGWRCASVLDHNHYPMYSFERQAIVAERKIA